MTGYTQIILEQIYANKGREQLYIYRISLKIHGILVTFGGPQR